MAGYQTAYDAYQAGQASALENLLRGLNAQKQQSELTGADVAGNALAGNATAGAPAPASGMNAPTAPSGDGAPPNLTPAPNPPPVTQVPMPGAAPMSAGPIPPPPMPSQIPPVNASQLQPPGQGGGAPPMAPMPQPQTAAPQGAPAGQGPAPAPQAGQMGQPQQNPWWKTMAAQIKQQNPNASGRDVMAALNAMQPVMSATNRQQLSDLHMQLAMQKLQSGQATPEEIDFLADEVKNGNQSILTRMPAPVRLAVMEKLETGGTSGSDAANSAVTYHGSMSEASAAGRQTGGIDVAGEGFSAIAPKALAASAQVPRSSWKIAAQVGNWLKDQQNDPALVKFANFNLGLVREYARAMGGTVAAQEKAQEALGTAKDQTAYKAAVESLQEEISAAQKGGKRAIKSAGGGASIPDPAGGSDDGIKLDTPPPPDGFVVQ